MPVQDKKNGSYFWTLKELIRRFYKSRFNRDNYNDPKENENIDDSIYYRLYAKSDLLEIIENFMDFLEWAIVEENISRVYLTKNIKLVRVSKMPLIRRANIIDEIKTKGRAKAGKQYVTHGRYDWVLEISGEPWYQLKKIQEKDPEFIAKREELEKVVEERNKNEEAKRGNKPTT